MSQMIEEPTSSNGTWLFTLTVIGQVIFLLGVPILWKSKSQKSVALSSSEAEYFAMNEAVK
jgi:hypothetical protein